MNQLKPFDRDVFANLNRALIGFDHIFSDRLSAVHSNYPPYNIVRTSDNSYQLELAVAGFSTDEISIEVNQDLLTIRGEKANEEEREYVHRGLAARNFQQNYTLAEYMVVQGATVTDGLLKITITKVVPEELKPRRIEIQ